MQFTSATILAALVAYVQAKAEFTNTLEDFAGIIPGEDFTLEWANAEGPVTILLKEGPSDDLSTVETLISGETGNSFTWSVPTNLPSGQYAFEIDDGDEVNYSRQFPLQGDGSAVVSSATVTVTSASVTETVTSEIPESTSSEAAESSSEAVSETSSAVESSATSEASSTLATESTSASASATESESAAASSGAAEVPDSKAASLGSPVALIMTLAAMLYFH
ncbi:hypothetical protein ACHAQA_002458 [Verticillium albo-atrum]